MFDTMPKTACPVLWSYAEILAIALPEDIVEQDLEPMIQTLSSSLATREVETARGEAFARVAVTEFAPVALTAAGFTNEGDRLRAILGVASMSMLEEEAIHAYTAIWDGDTEQSEVARDAFYSTALAAKSAYTAREDIDTTDRDEDLYMCACSAADSAVHALEVCVRVWDMAAVDLLIAAAIKALKEAIAIVE